MAWYWIMLTVLGGIGIVFTVFVFLAACHLGRIADGIYRSWEGEE
jgi:hypothetical protein